MGLLVSWLYLHVGRPIFFAKSKNELTGSSCVSVRKSTGCKSYVPSTLMLAFKVVQLVELKNAILELSIKKNSTKCSQPPKERVALLHLLGGACVCMAGLQNFTKKLKYSVEPHSRSSYRRSMTIQIIAIRYFLKLLWFTAVPSSRLRRNPTEIVPQNHRKAKVDFHFLSASAHNPK